MSEGRWNREMKAQGSPNKVTVSVGYTYHLEGRLLRRPCSAARDNRVHLMLYEYSARLNNVIECLLPVATAFGMPTNSPRGLVEIPSTTRPLAV